MATNKQRRDAERQRLQRQLEQRRSREVARKRFTLIASVVGTLVVIAAVVIAIVSFSGGDDKPAADKNASVAPTPKSSAPAACGEEQFPKQTVRAAKGATVSFAGVKITGAADLGGQPGVTSKATTAPSKLQYKDLVVGKGKAAGPTSCVTVQYDGVLYKTGKEFDSSWSRGMLAQFSLTRVVAGFTQGIGGTTGVPPMKVGGRRVIVVPGPLGYPQGQPPSIPANAPLVFVIDLTKVTS